MLPAGADGILLLRVQNLDSCIKIIPHYLTFLPYEYGTPFSDEWVVARGVVLKKEVGDA